MKLENSKIKEIPEVQLSQISKYFRNLGIYEGHTQKEFIVDFLILKRVPNFFQN